VYSGDVSGEHIVFQQAGNDLFGGQAFREADLMRDDFAIDDS